MRTLLPAMLFALVLGALLSLAIHFDTGYMRISLGHYLIETNFWVAVVLMLALVAASHILLRLLDRLRGDARLLGGWLASARERRARRRTARGLEAYLEGNWPQAHQWLADAAPHAPLPLMNCLAAARAAVEQDDWEAAEKLLGQARQHAPKAELAIGITRARLLLDARRNEQALATLLRLRESAPRHPAVLRLLQTTYTHLEDWHALSELLPEMRKRGLIGEEEARPLERTCWLSLLQQAAGRIRQNTGSSRSSAPLDQIWDRLPGPMRRDPDVIHEYARLLNELGEAERAEAVLRKVLRRHWDARLINLYGRLTTDKPEALLLRAEDWLKERPNDAELLLALGRLSLRNRLWGKAREYLETSLRMERKPETLAELCRLTANLGEHERSVQLLKEGLLDERGLPELPMPN